MPNSGKELGLDLFELYRAGTQNLPAVAGEYGTARSHVARALDIAPAVFLRHDIFGGSTGPAYGEWDELGRTLDTILNDTDENLRDTGQALVLAAESYAATDLAAKDELDRLKREHGVE